MPEHFRRQAAFDPKPVEDSVDRNGIVAQLRLVRCPIRSVQYFGDERFQFIAEAEIAFAVRGA